MTIAPEWSELSLGELERIQLIESYHRAAREVVPDLTAHATFHAIVENQIAMGLESVVCAVSRLMQQGLSRHDAVHAIGTVLADYFCELMNGDGGQEFATAAQARYDAAVERLTAQQYRNL